MASSFLSQIAKITDHLFLSSFMAASEPNVNKFGITCVITVCKEVPKLSIKQVESIKLDVVDRPNECLLKYFDFTADKIKEVADKNGKVLVHCVAGVSRSTTIVLAYLMKHYKMMLREAHDYVKSRRPFIRPNLGFWKQLVEYEQKLYGRNTVKIIPSNIGHIPDIYENEIKGLIWAPSSLSKPMPIGNASGSGLGRLTSPFADLSLSTEKSYSGKETSSLSKELKSPFKLFSNPPLKQSLSYQQLGPRRSDSPPSLMLMKKTNSSVFSEPSAAATAATTAAASATTTRIPPLNAQYSTTYRTSFQKH